MKNKLITALVVIVMVVTAIPTVSFASGDISLENETKGLQDEALEVSYDEEDLDTNEIAGLIEDVTGTSDVIDDIEEECGEFIVAGENADIVISENNDGEISIESEQISMELPREFSSMEGEIVGDGIVVYNEEESNVSASIQGIQQQEKDVLIEGFRSIITIENSNAAHEYTFLLNLPKGYKMIPAEEYYSDSEIDVGCIYIIEENSMIEDEAEGIETSEIMGIIASAWAKDANGNNVETSYRINGNELIQTVEFDENSAFPIVADPTIKKYPKPEVAFDWSATAYSIIPTVMNLDNRKIKVVATATIGDKSKKDTFYVGQGATKQGKIKWDLTTAYKQNIKVHFKITAQKRSSISKTMSGSRKLDSSLINSWTKSTFKSKEASINYHFKKHGIAESKYDNIKKYTSTAYSYRKKCEKGTGEKHIKSNGDVYYRWDFKSDRVYILLTKNGPTGKIITFGHYL